LDLKRNKGIGLKNLTVVQ